MEGSAFAGEHHCNSVEVGAKKGEVSWNIRANFLPSEAALWKGLVGCRP
jgi:hypothetical protein